jgi:4-hydroxybenzoate polyprenyltransferase
VSTPTLSPIRGFAKVVLLEHSVFALPFAYLAALHAGFAQDGTVHWRRLVLVSFAMVGARCFAMAANRIIDRVVDGQNPRTAGRELVTGVVPLRTAQIGAAVSLLVFGVAAGLLGPLCLALAPVALVPLTIYTYAKRFTDLPQVVLGIAQAIAPVGAWIAVTGHWSWHAVVLGLAVGAWIGGFDCIYACQDAEVDRLIGVRSVPARWGVAASLRASTITHVVTMGLFAWFGVLVHAGPWWWAGLAATAAVFAYEHSIVSATDLSRVNRAFFTANGFVGIGLLAFGVADLVSRGLAP